MATRWKMWVCGRSLAANVCLEWVFCIFRYRSQRRADRSSRGVLPSVVYMRVIVKPRKWGGSGRLGTVAPWGGRGWWCEVPKFCARPFIIPLRVGWTKERTYNNTKPRFKSHNGWIHSKGPLHYFPNPQLLYKNKLSAFAYTCSYKNHKFPVEY